MTVLNRKVAMGLKARREREKEELRQEILDAARELFVIEGYENVSMRRIAEKINYSPTTIYLYFKDKADLLYQICEETFAKLVNKGDKIMAENADPLTALKKIGRYYVEFGLRNPNHYMVTFILPHEHGMDKEKTENSTGMRAFNFVKMNIEECVQCGIFRKVDADVASQVMWAGLHGITSLLIAHGDFPWVKKVETIDLLIEALCKGLMK